MAIGTSPLGHRARRRVLAPGCALVAVLLSAPATAQTEQATVRGGAVCARPGQTVAVPFTLEQVPPSTGLQPHGVAAFQLDIAMRWGAITFSPGNVAPKWTSDHVVRSRLLDTGFLRVVAYSPTNATLAAGLLLSVPVTIPPGASGTSVPLAVQGLVLSSANGWKLQLPQVQTSTSPARIGLTCGSARTVRLGNGSGSRGQATSPIRLELLGDGTESAISISLAFDPTTLSSPQVIRGADALAAALVTNTSMAASGALGVTLALPAGASFPAGTRHLADVTFTVAATAAASPATVGLADSPTIREVTDMARNPLAATFTGGTVTISGGWEADVAPRSSGGNGAVTTADWVQVARFAAGIETAATGSEFQKADCAPRASLGDSRITAADWVQAGRYAAGLDPLTPMGGPSSAVAGFAAQALEPASGELDAATSTSRRISVENLTLTRSKSGSVAVRLRGRGSENAVGFTVSFDPTLLALDEVTLGRDAGGATLQVSDVARGSGRLGVLLALPSGATLKAGSAELVRLAVRALAGGVTEVTKVALTDAVVARELVDVDAGGLPAAWRGGDVTLQAPGTTYYLGGAASLSGEGGTRWRTDAQVCGAGGGASTFSLDLLRRDEATRTPQPRTFTLENGRCAAFPDVLAFALQTSGAGTLRVTVAEGVAVPSARTLTEGPVGSVGSQLPVLADTRALATGELGVLPLCSQSGKGASGSRTNLYLQNLGGTPLDVVAGLYLLDGTPLGERTYTLRSFENRQIGGVFAGATSAPVIDGYINVRTITPDGRLLAQASVVDAATGDDYTTPALVPTSDDQYLPAVVHEKRGAGVARRSDLALCNADPTPARASLSLLRAAAGGSIDAPGVVLGPGSCTVLRDVVGETFRVAGGGTIRLRSGGSRLTAAARISLGTAAGRVASVHPGLTSRAAIRPGLPGMLLGLAESAGDKKGMTTTLSLTSLSEEAGTARVEVFAATGARLGSRLVLLEAGETVMLSGLLKGLSAAAINSAYATVTCESASLSLLAAASVVDLRSGDESFVVAEPLEQAGALPPGTSGGASAAATPGGARPGAPAEGASPPPPGAPGVERR